MYTSCSYEQKVYTNEIAKDKAPVISKQPAVTEMAFPPSTINCQPTFAKASAGMAVNFLYLVTGISLLPPK